MTEGVDEGQVAGSWTPDLAAERERGRRLRTATSALSLAALGPVVGLSLPWAVSADEHDPHFDPDRALQLDEPGPWRADGWWLLRDALGVAGAGSPVWTALLTLVPLVVAAVAAWALVRQDRRSGAAARTVGAGAAVVLLVVGMRLLQRPGVEPGAGYWLTVACCVVLAGAGFVLARALASDGAGPGRGAVRPVQA